MRQRISRRCLVASLCGLVMLGGADSARASKVDVSLSRVSGRPGEEVTLSLMAHTKPERMMSVLSFDVHYDPEILTLKTYRNGRAIGPNQLVLIEATTPGTIKIAITDMAKPAEPLVGLANGELASFTWTIQPTAKKGRLPLNLEGMLALDQSGKGIKTIRQTHGTITVKPVASTPSRTSRPVADPDSRSRH